MTLELLTVVLLLAVVPSSVRSQYGTDLQFAKTQKRIMDNYNNQVRPVIDLDKPLIVQLSVFIYKVIDMDTKSKTAKFSLWVKQEWYDPRLHWDSEENEGIAVTSVKPDEVWTPDTTLLNSLQMDPETVERPQPIRIVVGDRHHPLAFPHPDNSTTLAALVVMNQPEKHEIICSVDLYLFPFDSARCKLTFGSSTYSEQELNYTWSPHNDPLKYNQENLEWDVIDASVSKEYRHICFRQYYGDAHTRCVNNIVLSMRMVRKAKFYLAVLLIPAMVLMQATLVGIFTLSASDGERTEKSTLAITSISAVSFVFLYIGNIIPTSSDPVPAINAFLVFQLCLVMVAVLISCLLIRIVHQGHTGDPVPEWLLRVVLLRRWPSSEMKEEKILKRHFGHDDASDAYDDVYTAVPSVSAPKRQSCFSRLKSSVRETRATLSEFFSMQMERETEQRRLFLFRMQWRAVERRLGSICFVIFTAILWGTFCATFVKGFIHSLF